MPCVPGVRVLLVAAALLSSACSSGGSSGSGSGGGAGGGTGGGTSGSGGSQAGAGGTAGAAGNATGGGGSGSGGAPATCEGGGVCAAAAPAGWTGPVIVYSGAAPAPACPGAMSNSALAANAELAAPDPAQCSCQCQVKGATCKGSFDIQNFASTSCGSSSCAGGSSALELGTCYSYIAGTCSAGNPSPVVGWNVSVNATPSATCSPVENNVDPGPPSWKSTVLGCGSLSLAPGSCTGGNLCVPQPGTPFSAGACILKVGDEQCPAGPYAKRTVVYSGADDTRACSACSCGAASGGTCQGSLTFRSGAGCSGNTLGSGSVPGCVTKPSGSGYFVATATAVGASCPPSGGAPTGTVTPTGPTTLCCTQ